MPRVGSADAVLQALVQRGATLAVAESLTGGELCARLIDIPGASTVIQGGIVAYQNEAKARLLGVDHGLLARTGAVTEQVALQMASGVREALSSTQADYGVSTTGVAGPDPDPDTGVAPGTVFIAVVGPGATQWSEALQLEGSRPEIRQQTVLYALGLLERAVEESGH